LQRQLAGKNSLKFHSSLCKDDKYYANIGAAGIPKEQILNGETSMVKNPTRDGLLVTEDKLNKVSETMEEKVSSKSFSQKFSHLVYKSLEIHCRPVNENAILYKLKEVERIENMGGLSEQHLRALIKNNPGDLRACLNSMQLNHRLTYQQEQQDALYLKEKKISTKDYKLLLNKFTATE